jgi:hypothetical protein
VQVCPAVISKKEKRLMTVPPGGNQYYHGTEEWHACESGRRDVQAMIALGREIGEDNEDHLVMLGQAYIAGVRAERAKHRSGCT